MKNEKEIRNIGKLIFLHLFPGAILSLLYILISKTGIFNGHPRVITLGISAVFSIIPVELGILFYTAKKEHGSFKLSEILGLKSKLTIKEFVLYTILMFIIGGALLIVLQPVADFLLKTVFSWIPGWYNFVQDMSLFGKADILIAALISFFILTIVVPVVEEFYFRGFLMERMKWMGLYSVLLNVFLYSAYHFYQPWFIITRFVAMLPVYYFVYKKDSLKLGIIVHCLANSLDVIAYTMLLFS